MTRLTIRGALKDLSPSRSQVGSQRRPVRVEEERDYTDGKSNLSKGRNISMMPLSLTKLRLGGCTYPPVHNTQVGSKILLLVKDMVGVDMKQIGGSLEEP